MFLGRSLLRPNGLRQLPRSRLLRHVRQEPVLYRTLKVDTKQELSETVTSLVTQLKTAKDLTTIHDVYPTFVEDFRKVKLKSTAKSPLGEQDVTSILRMLASSGRPEDLQRIEELLRDLGPVFEMQPTLHMYTTIVEAFGKNTPPRVGLNFLAKMPTLPGAFTPNVDHFLAILEPAIDQVPFTFIRDTVSNMHRMGCKPNADVANIVIRSFWNSLKSQGQDPKPDAFTPVLDLLDTLRIPYHPSTSNLIAQLFDNAALNASGQKLRNMYEARFKESSGSSVLSSRLARVAQTSGVKAACELAEPMSKDQQLQSLRHILQYSATLADVDLVRKELGVQIDIRHWTMVISNACRPDNLTEALRLYNAATAAGIQPDAGLIAPILRCLWRKSVQKESDEYIDRAFALYRDLRKAVPPSVQGHQPQGPFKSSVRHSRGPDSDIFHCLFRLLTRNGDVEKYIPVANELWADMKEYNLPTAVSPVSASIICLSIQTATTAEEALEAFRDFKQNLDEDGYATVLQHFSKKQFTPNHIPSLIDYFGIVKEMKRAGLTVTPKVYTILLTQIGYLASKLAREGSSDPDFKHDLINATRRTHDMLSLDASIDPDAVLLSQLVNTYQRLGCFGDAYRVWELMYLTGNFNCVTVSNILDGCGYAYDTDSALNIWRKLQRDGFNFDLHNWNTMVECLCRCGYLEMALKLVVSDMPAAGKRPTLETVNVLLKFARNAQREEKMLEHIEKHLPSLYSKLQTTNPKTID